MVIAELVNRHAVDVRAKSAEEFAVFGAVRDIIRHAEEKLRAEELGTELMTIQHPGDPE